MILLDTHAVIWVSENHPRARRLLRESRRLYISPATLLELQILSARGGLRIRTSVRAVMQDDRWILDDPPSVSWFVEAADLPWTGDPFDRLLAAHARVRGWRLATADGDLLNRLGPSASFEL